MNLSYDDLLEEFKFLKDNKIEKQVFNVYDNTYGINKLGSIIFEGRDVVSVRGPMGFHAAIFIDNNLMNYLNLSNDCLYGYVLIPNFDEFEHVGIFNNAEKAIDAIYSDLPENVTVVAADKDEYNNVSTETILKKSTPILISVNNELNPFMEIFAYFRDDMKFVISDIEQQNIHTLEIKNIKLPDREITGKKFMDNEKWTNINEVQYHLDGKEIAKYTSCRHHYIEERWFNEDDRDWFDCNDYETSFKYLDETKHWTDRFADYDSEESHMILVTMAANDLCNRFDNYIIYKVD